MEKLAIITLLLAIVAAHDPAQGQDSRFNYTNMEEGFDAARESDKFVLVYLYSEEGGGFEAYDRIWEHPLVDAYTGELTIRVAINADSEEGKSFTRHLRRRLKIDARSPGIYFFSDTGRSLGNVQGLLEGANAPGRVLLALGAADYARHDGRRYSRRY